MHSAKTSIGDQKKMRAHILKANCCSKVHNTHLKLALPISGYVPSKVFGQKELVSTNMIHKFRGNLNRNF